MKKLFIIWIIFTFKSSLALNIVTDDSLKNKALKVIFLESQINIGSNHLPISFYSKFINGGEIVKKDKGSLENRNQINTSGFEFDNSYGIKFNRKDKMGWYVKYQHLSTGGAKYPQGLYNLIFDGNQSISESIDLTQTAFHFRKHQIIHFGFLKNKLSLGLALGNILNEYQGSLGDGDYISFQNPYIWEVSSNPNIFLLNNRTNRLFKNGNSIGLDFKYKGDILKNNSSYFGYIFEIQNLGIMYFHDEFSQLNNDTSFTYSGLSIEEIINFETTLDNLNNTISPNYNLENILQMSPFTLKGELNLQLEKTKLSAGIFHRFNSNYIPKTFVGIDKQVNNKINIGTNISYGGYNQLQLIGKLKINIKKSQFQLSLLNVPALIPSLGKSLGLNLQIQWQIN